MDLAELRALGELVGDDFAGAGEQVDRDLLLVGPIRPDGDEGGTRLHVGGFHDRLSRRSDGDDEVGVHESFFRRRDGGDAGGALARRLNAPDREPPSAGTLT